MAIKESPDETDSMPESETGELPLAPASSGNGAAGTAAGRKALEAMMGKIDRSEPLNRLGQSVSELVGKVIRPGKVKDLLSGTWLGHPVHPMLTDLPIGFWTSSFLLDLFGNEDLYEASDALVGMGVAAALPTAITGLSDLSDVSEDEGLGVGTAHTIGNAAALICYVLSFAARKSGARRSGILLSTAGAGFATAGGYFGGHLAYRRGVGVNQTAFQAPAPEWTKVIDESEFPENQPKVVRVEGDDVLVLRKQGRICAIANRCSHRGGPLNEGDIGDGTVTCPWHFSTFSLDDGSVVGGPATAPQPSYEPRVENGGVELRSRP